jgi:hypothetical protein
LMTCLMANDARQFVQDVALKSRQRFRTSI